MRKGKEAVEIPRHVRPIIAVIAFHFPLFGKQLTFTVPFHTSFWNYGGVALLWRTIVEAKSQNPYYADLIEKVIEYKDAPASQREYAQMTFTPVTPKHGASTAKIKEYTVMDTREDAFQDFLKGKDIPHEEAFPKTDDDEARELPPEEIE